MSQDPDKPATQESTAEHAATDGPASATAVEGPERPELYVAAAFAGAFLFARILKKIAE